ncbi:Beta-lactamase-like protein [Sulfitobacter noctilucae]|uniref:MBL fold metallo-hydrolase n=1 Tax=Sulfitobacter noctilucae TaxID=1342302 RepID=UPI0004697257|nr:MBL fold metallo-hydrolase [Sulfitobacter noctilucae]KIN61789.1 Beta-lactamase-like protein [Sulfitobacter noctilucae]
MTRFTQKFTNGVCAAALLAFGAAGSASAESMFEGCPSGQIMQSFIKFGQSGKMPQDLGKWLNTPADQAVAPWQPFDNVDYIGICWVSAWLIHTEEGAVLIDTAYGPFQKMIVDNIAKTGTDFADIKYVLMTHGHFDHVGGAASLKEVLPNAQFVMTQTGWDEALASAAESQGGPRAWNMIEPEIVVADGDEITLGGNTFTVVETPGHTWGTASYLYDVQDGDDTFRAITIGGLGLNAIEGPSQVEAYIESVDRVRALVEAEDKPVKVHLTTHGFSAGLDENRKQHEMRKDGEPNVFVDPQGLLDQVAGLRERAVKRLEVEQSK